MSDQSLFEMKHILNARSELPILRSRVLFVWIFVAFGSPGSKRDYQKYHHFRYLVYTFSSFLRCLLFQRFDILRRIHPRDQLKREHMFRRLPNTEIEDKDIIYLCFWTKACASTGIVWSATFSLVSVPLCTRLFCAYARVLRLPCRHRTTVFCHHLKSGVKSPIRTKTEPTRIWIRACKIAFLVFFFRIRGKVISDIERSRFTTAFFGALFFLFSLFFKPAESRRLLAFLVSSSR